MIKNFGTVVAWLVLGTTIFCSCGDDDDTTNEQQTLR